MTCRSLTVAVRIPRRAYTLVELLVSVASSAILLTGMASALVLAGRALPTEDRVTGKVIRQSQVAERIVADLQYARHITERTANAITFTVADRDGDGSPERIRYAWSAAPGDPLTWQYNSDPAVTVLDDVHQFDLAYDLKTVTEEYPGPPVEGAETLLSSYTGAVDIKEYKVAKDQWIGQYFEPPGAVFPADALSWRVTRVQFVAKKENDNGELTWVQLRSADTDRTPTDTVLAQVDMYETVLASFWRWEEFSLSNAPDLVPGEAACLVLQHCGSDGPSAKVAYDDDDGSGRLRTSNGGDSWEYDSDEAMQYAIYGRVSTPGPSQTATREFVTAVRIALQAGDDTDARIDTAARTLNTPEVLSAVWELDFDTDPTALDMNADGVGDWVRRDAQAFNLGTLSGGVWYADTTLDTYPDNNFTELTTVDVRFRNTDTGANAAVLWVNADWASGEFAPVIAFIELQTDNTQTLTVYHHRDDATMARLIAVPGLSDGFVALRLLVDPDLDTVNVQVNGEDKGTYVYNTYTPPSDKRFTTLRPQGSDAEFDYVRIRVGGN